jgi:cobalamin biosynthesis Mg chelatase CobN
MNISEYKTKIKELEVRVSKVQKEYDRQQVIREQSLDKLAKMGITDVSQIDAKLTEMKVDIDKNQEKLDKYLAAFEEKLKAVEELIK